MHRAGRYWWDTIGGRSPLASACIASEGPMFATAKVERAQERAAIDRSQGRERQVERGGDFDDQPPF
jgi:hypothetical protein